MSTITTMPIGASEHRPSRWLRWTVVVLAVVGCVICMVLIRIATPTSQPPKILGADICPTTGSVNCDYVLNSRWASIGPLPASVLGLAYFGLVALWFAAVGVPSVSARRWHLVPLVVVIAGVCGSLAFLYVLAFQLPVWCTWCVAAHVVNLWILIFTVLTWPRRGGLEPEVIAAIPRHPTRAHVAAVLGFAVALLWIIVTTMTAYNFAVLSAHSQTQLLKAVNNSDYILWKYRQAPLHDIPIRPDDPAVGPLDAPFTVVVFSDFQCPVCRAFRQFADRLTERFPDRLRLVFKEFPVSAQCNRHVSKTQHFFSCAAAEALEAARSVGTDEQVYLYYRKLFDNMASLDRRPYERIAGQVGIDRARFASALDQGVGRERIAEDADLGNELKIEGTPALFLNGRMLPNWRLFKADSSQREPLVDLDATLALWDELLAEEPSKQPAE